MEPDDGQTTGLDVDATAVDTLISAGGLDLAPNRAMLLVPMMRAILDADRRLRALDLEGYDFLGTPWDAARRRHG